jgi:hypothetical protein
MNIPEQQKHSEIKNIPNYFENPLFENFQQQYQPQSDCDNDLSNNNYYPNRFNIEDIHPHRIIPGQFQYNQLNGSQNQNPFSNPNYFQNNKSNISNININVKPSSQSSGGKFNQMTIPTIDQNNYDQFNNELIINQFSLNNKMEAMKNRQRKNNQGQNQIFQNQNQVFNPNYNNINQGFGFKPSYN